MLLQGTLARRPRVTDESVCLDKEAVVDDSCGDLEAELVDLSDMKLTDLRTLGDAPLAHSLRRIIEESQDETIVVVSGFNSSITSEDFRWASDGE